MRDDRGIKISIAGNGIPMSYAEVLQYLRNDADFRLFFFRLLADTPYVAFRWETPPVTVDTARRSFEFVLLDSPALASRSPNSNPFADRFARAEKTDAIAFPNLGKDALLIVPLPGSPRAAYGHLAAFSRYAREVQQHALWELVGEAMQRRLGTQPVWLSTAGAGVSWLHVRLDDRPKYYSYAPYRQAQVIE